MSLLRAAASSAVCCEPRQRQTRSLLPWSLYRTRGKRIEGGSTFRLASTDLTERATDKEIEAALPEGYLFDESGVCALKDYLTSVEIEKMQIHANPTKNEAIAAIIVRSLASGE